jgi:hypothetical protein
VLENYRRIVARLARMEDTEVLLLGPTNHARQLARNTRKTQSNVDRFRAAMREEAQRRRFLWLDRQALSVEAADRDSQFTDGLHKTPDFHARITHAVAAMLAPRLAPLVGSSSTGGAGRS